MKTLSTITVLTLSLCAGSYFALAAQQNQMSFFVTSAGSGKGGDLGGIAGADARCQMLAAAAGSTGKTWHAYLSTQGQGAVNARDRIGAGPWYNAKGQLLAQNVADLHGANPGGNTPFKQLALNEKGGTVNGVGDLPQSARYADRLAGERDGLYRRRRPHVRQLDEQHDGHGAARPSRPHGRRRHVVEFPARFGGLQPTGFDPNRRQRIFLLLRDQLTRVAGWSLASFKVLQHQPRAVQVSGWCARVNLKRVPRFDAQALRELDLDPGLVDLLVPRLEARVV